MSKAFYYLILSLFAMSNIIKVAIAELSFVDKQELMICSYLGGKIARWYMPQGDNLYFRNRLNFCVQADGKYADSTVKRFYTDDQCRKQVAFKPMQYQLDFCDDWAGATTADYVRKTGNAASWEADRNQVNDTLPQIRSQKWTINYGSTLQFNIAKIGKNHVPFMKKLEYKAVEVDRGNGLCQLEMRVFKKDLAGKDLKPLLMIHGGVYRGREIDYQMMETEVSHFTERGMIVFVMFHRLTSTISGNVECNNASLQDVLEDGEDALQFIVKYGPALGAKLGSKINILGQSSGGHLAAWLSFKGGYGSDPNFHSTQWVEKVALFYPPVDFYDYVMEMVDDNGDYYHSGLDVPLYASEKVKETIDASFRSHAIDIEGIFWGTGEATISKHATLHQAATTRIFECLEQDQALGCQLLDLADPPQELKQQNLLAEVNAYTSPKLFVVHGLQDAIVPAGLSMKLCQRYGGNGFALNNISPAEDEYSIDFSCGLRGQLRLLTKADHLFDALCFEANTCGAGGIGEAKQAAIRALIDVADWLAE